MLKVTLDISIVVIMAKKAITALFAILEMAKGVINIRVPRFAQDSTMQAALWHSGVWLYYGPES